MWPAHDPELESEGYGLSATPGPKLHEDAFEMTVHRPLADAERPGDFLRGLTKRDVS